MTKAIRVLVFDAYGTLFDVHSVIVECESAFPGKGAALSQMWRSKQLEYTWLRSLMGRYEDFESVTAAALNTACRSLGLGLGAALAERLLRAYRTLVLFPEVKHALEGFRSRRKLAILSNGSPEMLNAVVRHAGLDHLLDAVISVDSLGVFKPHPSVYALATAEFGVDPAEIGFVSSNYWDIAGATSFGFRTYWINRTGQVPDDLGFTPVAVLRSLDELTAHLES
jgi:2-haloacid dehalogenase